MCNFFHLCGSINSETMKSEIENMKLVKEINATDFSKEVVNAEVPVVVDFYAPWCGPCKMLSPVLEKLASEFNGKVKFVKVNVDDAAELANAYNITGVPTLILFKGGKVADVSVGFSTEGALRSMIARVAEQNSNPSSGGGCCCCGM